MDPHWPHMHGEIARVGSLRTNNRTRKLLDIAVHGSTAGLFDVVNKRQAMERRAKKQDRCVVIDEPLKTRGFAEGIDFAFRVQGKVLARQE